MGKNEVIGLLRRFADSAILHFPVEKVVLFGSYNTGRQRPDSDIDVAVIVSEDKMGFLKSAPLFWDLGVDIDPRIEPILFEKGDPDPSGFLADILANGEVVWEA